MLAKIAFAVALLIPIDPANVAGRAPQHREFWDWLLLQASEIDFDQMTSQRTIYALVTIAEGCHAMDQHELAREYFERSLKIHEMDGKANQPFTLFNYALDTNQLDLAGQIAEDSGSPTLLDRWDLERFRRGDQDSIERYPRVEMTFYNAIELANVFIELGHYDRAEEFVTDIEIRNGNEPEDVTGITLENIAKRYRADGDVENAKRYIDKAKAIAGNQFYTGYAINITYRSIHGVLTEDLDEFARRGAAYPVHMGRELIALLASELVRTGYDEEAKRVVSLLKEPEDFRRTMRGLAMGQARRGDITAALKTVEALEDRQAKNAARLGISRVLCDTGGLETASELADLVMRDLNGRQEIDENLARDLKSLAQLYGRLCCRSQLEQLINRANTPLLKTDCLLRAITGFADAARE
jgi:tetratricopeptide (TPR) repeat protein